MYICQLLIAKIEHQTNTDHSCPLKRGNTQSELHLVHNIDNIKYFKDFRLQISGIYMKSMDFTIRGEIHK